MTDSPHSLVTSMPMWLWLPLVALASFTFAPVGWAAPPKKTKAPAKRAAPVKRWQGAAFQKWAKYYGTFPRVTGETLASTKRTLPADFPGKVNFVILSFARAHQKPMQTWLPFLQQLRKQYKGFDYLSMPLMGGFARIFGGLIKRGMRKAYKSQDTRLRLMPMFTDKDKIIKRTRVRNTAQIAVMLVDQKGRIFWHSKGPKTPQMARSLTARLQLLYR